MPSADSLPEIVSPAMFLEKLVPGWAEDVFSPPMLIEDVAFQLQIEVEGASESPWSIGLDLGDYSVSRGTASRPLLTIRGKLAHWNMTWGQWIRDLAKEIEEAGGPEEFIEKIESIAKKQGHAFKLSDEKLEALAGIPTVFACQIENFQGQELTLRVGLYNTNLEEAPRFTLKMDGETFVGLREQKVNPVTAWKQKRIELKGDLVHATKLLRILQRKD